MPGGKEGQQLPEGRDKIRTSSRKKYRQHFYMGKKKKKKGGGVLLGKHMAYVKVRGGKFGKSR